jgi:hypothetical protein
MRWCWLLVAACNRDPSLDITVHHPANYAVKQTLVTAYFGGDILCNDIEFGDRTDEELAAITVDEVDATSGGQIEVSRLGGKSIVARGYDAQHRFVTAGCKDLGEVTGKARVQIDTQPTAIVAIDPGQPDRPFAERDILVNMTDTKGMPLDGQVSWLLTGPAGAVQQMASAGTPTRNGNIKFKVDDVMTPGPEGLRIRAPWATAPLPLVTGFDLSHSTTLQLPGGGMGGDPACAVRGHTGKPPTLICLGPAGLQGHRDAIEISWQGTQFVATPVSPAIPASIDNQFALFVDHDGTADESVYVLSAAAGGAGNWYKLGAASGQTVVFDNSLQNVVYVPRCHENSVSALVVVQTGALASTANRLRFYLPSGSPAPAPLGTVMDGEVLSGGCVHDVDKKEHQGVVTTAPSVVAGGDTSLATLQLVTASGLVAVPGTRLTGSGFVTMTSQSTIEKRFAGTRIQASGTVVFESVLAPDAGAFKLVERTEVDSAAPPVKIIAGKLDRDGDTDLMWDMAVGARRRLFQVSLAEQVSGAPLTAMTSGPNSAATANTGALDFTAADLNGGGTDEMIVFSASAVTIYSPD